MDALAAQQHPITWTLIGATVVAQQGKPFRALLHAQIPFGWHLYSTTQPPGGPIATVITIPDGGFVLVGMPKAREPDLAPDNNFEIVTETYADSVTWAIPLMPRVAGAATLHVKVGYQTCTDRYCLPPTDEALELPVQVAPGSGATIAAVVAPAPTVPLAPVSCMA